jgi:hypothetical protein
MWSSSCLRVFVAIIAVALFASASCSHAPSAGKDAVLWRQVGTWSGHGNSQTGSFSVETGALRLHWETRNPPADGGVFKVSLHSAISGRPLQVVVDRHGAGRDTLYIEDEPRVSYLVVVSDLDWQLALEEAVPATAGP